MKRQPGLQWLADLPAHAVLDTVARLDGALRRMVNERKARRKCGFPRARKKFVNEAGIYCVGPASEIGHGEAVQPKIGRGRLSGGDVPQWRLLAARVWRDSDRWMILTQFECARPEPLPASDIVVAVDLDVSTLVTAFDGTGIGEVAPWNPLPHPGASRSSAAGVSLVLRLGEHPLRGFTSVCLDELSDTGGVAAYLRRFPPRSG